MNKTKNRFNGWMMTAVIIFAFFALFIIFPIVLVLYKSFVSQTTGQLTLDYFIKFFSRRYYWGTLINSLTVTLCATAFSVIIGLPMAYIMKSVKIHGNSVLSILIIISYISPPFIGAYAWIQLLGRNGTVTRLLNSLFHIKFNGIYGFWGIVLVFTLQCFPLIYIYLCGALKNMDNSLNEAAESLGCVGMKRVMRIVIPLILPTLLASALLVFAHVFADFGTPMLIGEGYKTVPVMIYNEFMSEVGGNDGFAAALSIIVIGVTTILFFVQKYVSNHNMYSMTALKPISAKQEKGIKNILAHVFVYLIVFFAILPQLVVIYTSFLKNNGGQVFTGGFSFQSYQATLLNKDNSCIWNTYIFGITAIAIILVLGTIVPYLTVRKRNALTSLLDTLTMFPFIIPGSVLGIAFLFAFSNKPLLLSGTAAIMIIAFTIRRLPYTIRSSTAIIGQISPSIEEAAISLGATEKQAFTHVMVPMMAPGVLSGAIMSWITVISELSSSIILYNSNTQTLTVSIYTEVIRGNYGNASAYSTILTLTSIVSLLIFFKLSGKKEISI